MFIVCFVVDCRVDGLLVVCSITGCSSGMSFIICFVVDCRFEGLLVVCFVTDCISDELLTVCSVVDCTAGLLIDCSMVGFTVCSGVNCIGGLVVVCSVADDVLGVFAVALLLSAFVVWLFVMLVFSCQFQVIVEFSNIQNDSVVPSPVGVDPVPVYPTHSHSVSSSITGLSVEDIIQSPLL